MSKIVNLSQHRNSKKLNNMREDEDRLVRLEGELIYRTSRIVEELDTFHERIESIEKSLRSLIKIMSEDKKEQQKKKKG